MKKYLLISLLFFVIIGAVFSQSGPSLIVHASGTPDEHGNRIYSFKVQQFINEKWKEKGTVYNSTYKPETKLMLSANISTVIHVSCLLNSSLVGSAEEAGTYTNVILTVVGADSLPLTNKTVSGPSGNFYNVTCQWSWYDGPGYGITYLIIVEFKIPNE